MNKEIFKNKLFEYIPFLIFFIFSLFLHRDVGMRDYDDYVFKDQWVNITVLEWMKQFYLGWSGRIPIHILYIIFLQLPLVVLRVVSSVVYTLGPVFIARNISILGHNNSSVNTIITNTVVCISFLLIPQEVLNRTVFWFAGAFNYIWPGMCLFLALMPFATMLIEEKINKLRFVFSFLAIFLCCYAEQSAAIFVCMSSLAVLYMMIKKRTVPALILGLWFSGMINMIIEYVAPGNLVRYDAEVILWCNHYDMYAIIDKLFLGLTYCLKMLLSYGWIFFVIILLLMIPKIINEGLIFKIVYIFMGIATAVLIYVLKTVEEKEIIYDFPKNNILLIIMFLWVLMMVVLLYTLYIDKKEIALTVVFSVLAAIASGTVAAMSPSYFVSEQRIFYISYLMLIFVIGLQMQEIELKCVK